MKNSTNFDALHHCIYLTLILLPLSSPFHSQIPLTYIIPSEFDTNILNCYLRLFQHNNVSDISN
jgi:hypothetical protein